MDDNTNTHSDQEECRDYKRNVCTKGSACKYYHPPKDVSAIFERNSVCHDYQNQKVSCTLHDLILVIIFMKKSSLL